MLDSYPVNGAYMPPHMLTPAFALPRTHFVSPPQHVPVGMPFAENFPGMYPVVDYAPIMYMQPPASAESPLLS